MRRAPTRRTTVPHQIGSVSVKRNEVFFKLKVLAMLRSFVLLFASMLTCVFLLSTGAVAAGKKRADIQILEFKAERGDDLISVHAKVKNIGERTLQRVNIIFRFVDTQHATVTTQRTALEKLSLAPGEDSEIDAQMQDAPRAVWVMILAERSGGVETRVAGDGPYTVE
jgi:hypothetical protein